MASSAYETIPSAAGSYTTGMGTTAVSRTHSSPTAKACCYALGMLGLLASGGLAMAAAVGRLQRPDLLPMPPEPATAGSQFTARRLAQAPDAATGTGNLVSGWDALTRGDIDVAQHDLDVLRKNWQPADEASLLPNLVARRDNVVWGNVNQTLFGANSTGLQGGIVGASQAVGLDLGLNGVSSACATFAARFPDLLTQRIKQNGSTLTVHLQLKTLSEAGGFRDFPVQVNGTLPVINGTHTLATLNPAPNATWSLFVAKAIWSLTLQSHPPYSAGTFVGALEALTGREMQEVGLTRLADGPLPSGPFNDLAGALPSLHFDTWMQRLGDTRYGGLVFRDGRSLLQSPAYDANTGVARYADGNLSAVLGGTGVRVQAKGLDVVLLGVLPYGVVGVGFAEPANKYDLPHPDTLTLMAGTGFTYDPRQAAASPQTILSNISQIPGPFGLPVSWAKRLAISGYFA